MDYQDEERAAQLFPVGKAGGTVFFSEKELRIVVKQSGVQILRYHLYSRTAERFYDTAECFGVFMEGNVPEVAIKQGVVSADTVAECRRLFDDIHRGIPCGVANIRMRTPSGEFRWYHANYTLLPGRDEQSACAILTFFDNTEQRAMQLAQEKWKSGFSVLIAESILYVEANLTKNRIDLQGGARVESYQRKGNHAVSYGSFVKYGTDKLVFSEDRASYAEFFDRVRLLSLFVANVEEDTLEYRLDGGTGEPKWVRANVRMTCFPYSDDVMAVIAYLDIDQQRRELENLAQKAAHDSLTGILNRGALEKEIAARLTDMRSGDLAGLFMIDLDRFKLVNDDFGHRRGDELLQQTAAELSRLFEPHGLVGRLGGDEFMAFLCGRFSRGEIEQMAANIVNCLQVYFGGTHKLNISASVGVAVCHGKESFEEMYARADSVLYSAKDNGKCQYRFFEDGESCADSEPESESEEETGSIWLQSLMEYMGGGIAVGKVSGKEWTEIEIVYTSPGFFGKLGYGADTDKKARNALLSYVDKEDLPGLLEAVKTTAGTQQATKYCYRTLTPGSTEVYWRLIHITYLPSTHEDCRFVIGAISDITGLPLPFSTESGGEQAKS